MNEIAHGGLKDVLAQPTKALVDSSYAAFQKNYPSVNAVKIHGETCDNVGTALRDKTKIENWEPDERAVFCTHSGLLQTPYLHNAEDWRVFFDDGPSPIWSTEFDLKRLAHYILPGIDVLPAEDGYHQLICKDAAFLNTIAEDRQNNMVSENLKDLARKLLTGFWKIYVLPDQWTKCTRTPVKDGQLLMFGLLDLKFFDLFGEVIFMSANFNNTIIGQYLAANQIPVAKHKRITRNLAYQAHPNGHLLSIYYAQTQDWSKRLRDSMTSSNGELMDVNQCIINDAMALLQDEPFAYAQNKDVKTDRWGGRGELLPNVSHGLNTYQHLHNAVIIPALRPTPAYMRFLTVIAGLDPEQVHHAIYCEQIYQAVMRISLRNPYDQTPKKVIVADFKAASFLVSLFPNSSLQALPHNGDPVMPEKKPHGNAKYETPVERDMARKTQEAARAKANRWKTRNSNLPETGSVTIRNSTHDSSLAYTRIMRTLPPADRPAISLPQQAQQPKKPDGCLDSLWHAHATKKTYEFDYGEIRYANDFIHRQFRTGDEWFDYLKQCGTKIFPNKNDNRLFAPAEFDLTKDPGKGHTKKNHVFSQGIVLDVEHTDLTPEQFHQILPYKMLVYSSWNHSPDQNSKHGWRYHICIPTQPMTYDAMEAVKRMCWRKVEEWIATSSQPNRRHGFDPSKMSPVALYFLPSHRPDGFIKTFEAKLEFDHNNWIKNCPLDIIDDCMRLSPNTPPPLPDEIATAIPEPQPQQNNERWLARIIQVWQERGCFKGAGRTQFWRLSKALREQTSLADYDIRAILHEQAGYATNPQERRGEIEYLMGLPKAA